MGVTFSNLATDVEVIDEHELTAEERAEHDYLDWAAMERGEETASFVRYLGTCYLLADFSMDWGITRGAGLPEEFRAWHGYLSDSFFSGVVIRYRDDHDESHRTVDLATFITGD
jgi:hypothetical protein